MGILRRIACKAGQHHGQWSYPGRRCETVRICDACGARQEIARHTWGSFGYAEDGRCEQVRRCTRCGTTETGIRHDWGPWLYLGTEFSSPQVHTCRRCHETEKTAPTLR